MLWFRFVRCLLNEKVLVDPIWPYGSSARACDGVGHIHGYTHIPQTVFTMYMGSDKLEIYIKVIT